MRKWWIAFVAGAIVVGCAGGSGGSQSGSTGTGVTTGATTSGTTGTVRVVPDVVLPTQLASVKVLFLSGQGRRSPGSQYAQLNNIHMNNGGLTEIPSSVQGSLEGVGVKLDGYSVNTYNFTQAITDPYEDYSAITMDVASMKEEDFNGDLNTIFNGPAVSLPSLPISARIAKGRTTTVQLYMNNAALFFQGGVQFSQADWDIDNLVNGATSVQGFFSDAIGFDISSVIPRPAMKSGPAAQRILLTGDSTALASGSGTDGSVDLYSTAFVESGVLTNPVLVGDQIAPGTYNILEPDPSAIPPSAPRILALQGNWVDYKDVVKNGGNEIFLVIPGANNNAQCILFKRNNAGNITACWVGRATINAQGVGTFELWSVDQVDDNTENNKATGTFGNVTLQGTRIKDGDFTISSPPSGFPFKGTGVFVVYN